MQTERRRLAGALHRRGVVPVVHVVMVFAVDPYAIRAMTTGGYDDDRFSPEARNARPFTNLAPATVEKGA